MSMKSVKEFLCSKPVYSLSGMLIGGIIFVLLYGFATLASTNVSFLYNNGDKDAIVVEQQSLADAATQV